MTQPVAASLWIKPAGPARDRCREACERARARHGGPHFEPHVTLLGSIALPADEAERRLQQLAQRLQPFELRLNGIGRGHTHFHRLFAEVELTPPLRDGVAPGVDPAHHADHQLRASLLRRRMAIGNVGQQHQQLAPARRRAERALHAGEGPVDQSMNRALEGTRGGGRLQRQRALEGAVLQPRQALGVTLAQRGGEIGGRHGGRRAQQCQRQYDRGLPEAHSAPLSGRSVRSASTRQSATGVPVAAATRCRLSTGNVSPTSSSKPCVAVAGNSASP